MIKGRLGKAGLVLALACLAQGAAPSAARAQGADWRDQVLTLVNQQRAAAGLNPLRLSAELTNAAQSYSQYMASAGFFAHTGPDGSTPKTRQEAAGYSNAVAWGENIAAGQPNPQAVMTAWMNSPGHRANILYRSFTEIGIGIYSAPGSQYGMYWTQEFGSRPQATSNPGNSYQPAPSGPSLGTINPTQGKVGDMVTLAGSRFGSSLGRVSFSGVAGTVVSWADTQIRVRVPAGASSGSVYVQTAGGGTSNGRPFTVTTGSAPPPASQPTPPPSAGTGSGASLPTSQPVTATDWAQQILTLVNQERAKAGLRPLQWNSALALAAQRYSQYMATADFFDHTGPDGSRPPNRQQAAGYTGATWWGENIAAGQPDPQAVMTAWMNSPGHRANILNANFTELGVGIYTASNSRYRIYWTQEFGARPGTGGGSTNPPAPAPHPAPAPAPTPSTPTGSQPSGTGTGANVGASPFQPLPTGGNGTSTSQPAATDWQSQVLALVNQYRAQAGLGPLTMNAQLTLAADRYSQYMANADFFAHTGPDGSTPPTRQQAAGYTGATWWGENIAAGQPDPQAVMTAWMNSPGHRANILNPNFTEIGIGIYKASGTRYGVYWTQEFGARAGTGGASSVSQPGPAAFQSQPAGNDITWLRFGF